MSRRRTVAERPPAELLETKAVVSASQCTAALRYANQARGP
ncbi:MULTISPECIES: hypothetical protein [Streptomyces]|nr:MULTISPECIES: hypothetical protein [Streptomyces]MDX3067183.1 hypothetical protein [Streptomyces sp. ND04-05B]MDX3519497.1 hypothetical protein [Streptomyces scabiei]